MKTLILPIHDLQSGPEVLALLEKENLRKGDKLDILVKEEDKALQMLALLLLLAVVFLAYFGKKEQDKRIADGESILKGLFAKQNSKEMEKELEALYGIEIEFVRQEDSDEEDWARHSFQNLSAAYSEDEPDYADVTVKEPNPDYKPA